MKRKAWLTPDSLPMDTICRQTVLPNSPEWTSAVNGALLPLTYPSSWEQFGSLTPEETAARFSEMYWQWYASECGGACPAPTLPTGQRIYRINPTTQRWEWLTADDTWDEPTGEDAIPAPDARIEATSAERICAAASNVVNIIRELYDTVVTDANNSLDASQAAANIGAAIGAWISARIFPPAAAYIAAAAGAWNAFYEIAAVVVMDLWNDSFEDAYKCALISNATDTGGVVTFDFFGVNRQLASEIFWSGQYVLLVAQVLYIHYVIGSDGLNLAGSKGNVAGDCDECGQWAREFDFSQGPAGWTATSPGDVGTWNAAGYWASVAASGNNTLIIRCTPAVASGFTIRRVWADYYASTVSSWSEFGMQVYPTTSWQLPLVVGRTQYDKTGLVSLNTSRVTFRAFRNSLAGAGTARLHKVRIWGTGIMPFADHQGRPYYGP